MIKQFSDWIIKQINPSISERYKLTSKNIERVFMEISSGDTTYKQNRIPDDYLNMKFNINGCNSHDKESRYFGRLILQKNEDFINASWNIGFSNDKHEGTGFIKNNLLGINFHYIVNNERCQGRIIFFINKKKNLQGIWQEIGVDEVGTESAFPF